jgi:hypothetical protein
MVFVGIGVGIVCLAAMGVHAEDPRDGHAVGNSAKRLFSEKQTDREQLLEQFTAQYTEVSTGLLKTLEEAATKHRGNRRYHSPLHCVILACLTSYKVAVNGSKC